MKAERDGSDDAAGTIDRCEHGSLGPAADAARAGGAGSVIAANGCRDGRTAAAESTRLNHSPFMDAPRKSRKMVAEVKHAIARSFSAAG